MTSWAQEPGKCGHHFDQQAQVEEVAQDRRQLGGAGLQNLRVNSNRACSFTLLESLHLSHLASCHSEWRGCANWRCREWVQRGKREGSTWCLEAGVCVGGLCTKSVEEIEPRFSLHMCMQIIQILTLRMTLPVFALFIKSEVY